MQNENKPQHWKQKLEDTALLSADLTFNKSAAWDKLEHCLQQKRNKRKAVWYWVAAACFIPLFLFLSITLHQPNNNNKTINAANHQAAKQQEIREANPPKNNTTLLATDASPVKTKAVIKKIINKNVLITTKEKSNDIPVDSVVTNNEETVLMATDSVLKSPVVLQAKAKLKVVHINELGEPVEIAPVIAHNSYLRVFPFPIAQEESYASPLQTKNKISFISLKTKSSTN